jgi:tRNA (guanine37-N1)-methyltransferase
MPEDMRPPINRAMRTLDRSFFKTTLSLSAARIFQNQHISQCRAELIKSKDITQLDNLDPVRPDPATPNKKCLLLRSDIKHDDSSTWSSTIQELIKAERIGVIPFTVDLDYDYWNYHDIMSSILPEEFVDDLPSGFQIIGHVAHLNLRDHYVPYKSIIADVLMDKNAAITTVIRKIDEVGEENEYRTFRYELLAGPDNLNVSVREQGCTFDFDYAKVYWNSRLNTEHERLVGQFNEGEAVCDVMAGIGPFAIPAGKKRVFVWANDLNPESFAALENGIKLNKTSRFVKPFNQDGRKFIPKATASLYKDSYQVALQEKQSRSLRPAPVPEKRFVQPKLFSHFVMNLPASATTFLPSFIGLYSEAGIPPNSPPPKIHVYCFSTKSDDNAAEGQKICEELSSQLGFTFRPGSGEAEGEVEIFDVRDVAPKKRMFCASFRLPVDVAYKSLPG